MFAKHVLKEALIWPSLSATVWLCWRAYQKEPDSKFYWSDSTNRAKVHTKCGETFPRICRHEENSCNPADDASRSLKEHKLAREHRWITGPSFRSLPGTEWSLLPRNQDDISVEDLEVKRVVVHSMEITENYDMLSRL